MINKISCDSDAPNSNPNSCMYESNDKAINDSTGAEMADKSSAGKTLQNLDYVNEENYDRSSNNSGTHKI